MLPEMSDFSDEDETVPQVEEKQAKVEEKKPNYEFIASEPLITLGNDENKFAKPVKMKLWWFVHTESYPLQWENSLKRFLYTVENQCEAYGMGTQSIAQIKCKEKLLEKLFKKAKEQEVQYLIIASNGKDHKFHSTIKSLEQRFGIATCHVLYSSIVNEEFVLGQNDLVSNLVKKANMKLGGLNYYIKKDAENYFYPDDLIIGINVNYFDLPGYALKNSKSSIGNVITVIGFAANDLDEPNVFTGDYVYCKKDPKVILHNLNNIVYDCIFRFREHHNKCPNSVKIVLSVRDCHRPFKIMYSELKALCFFIQDKIEFEGPIQIINFNKLYETSFGSDESKPAPGTVLKLYIDNFEALQFDMVTHWAPVIGNQGVYEARGAHYEVHSRNCRVSKYMKNKLGGMNNEEKPSSWFSNKVDTDGKNVNWKITAKPIEWDKKRFDKQADNKPNNWGNKGFEKQADNQIESKSNNWGNKGFDKQADNQIESKPNNWGNNGFNKQADNQIENKSTNWGNKGFNKQADNQIESKSINWGNKGFDKQDKYESEPQPSTSDNIGSKNTDWANKGFSKQADTKSSNWGNKGFGKQDESEPQPSTSNNIGSKRTDWGNKGFGLEKENKTEVKPEAQSNGEAKSETQPKNWGNVSKKPVAWGEFKFDAKPNDEKKDNNNNAQGNFGTFKFDNDSKPPLTKLPGVPRVKSEEDYEWPQLMHALSHFHQLVSYPTALPGPVRIAQSLSRRGVNILQHNLQGDSLVGEEKDILERFSKWTYKDTPLRNQRFSA